METTNAARLPLSAPLKKLHEAPTYDLTAPTNEEQRMLRNLLKAHHSTAAPLRDPDMILHNHMPHILGSALDLGVGAAFLEKAYETVLESLLKIDSTFVRGEKIEKGRVREYFGQREYTVAFVDYFDAEFERAHGDWKKVTEDYLFLQEQPLMNGLVGGLGHPVIHLAYAYELNSKKIASEGLSLLCTDYSEFHHLLDQAQPDTSTYKARSLAEVLERVRQDSRFDGIVEHPGILNTSLVMEKRGAAVLEHWNAWEVVDPLQQLEQICDLATVIAMSTYDDKKEFDFYLIHLMTVAHGLRVLWLRIPQERQVPMLREYAIMAISVYITQQRPPLSMDQIEAVDLHERSWDWVKKTAIEHPAKFDVHFFKVVRAPKAFEDTYGEKEGFYLKASVKFLDEFRGWTGFGLGLNGFDPKGEGWTADA